MQHHTLPRKRDGSLDRQQTLNIAVNAIRQQGGPSYDGTSCLYRGPEGRACAIGHFMTDGEACDFEGQISSAFTDRIWALKGKDVDFLDSLQMIHDNSAQDTTNDADFLGRFEVAVHHLVNMTGLQLPPAAN